MTTNAKAFSLKAYTHRMLKCGWHFKCLTLEEAKFYFFKTVISTRRLILASRSSSSFSMIGRVRP